MNVAEAIRTQSLLAWLSDPNLNADAGIALSSARFLADRAQRALGAGPGADETEAAIERRLAVTRKESERLVLLAQLVEFAQLLRPCPQPDYADGWNLCSHAEAWPCTITRAAWIAAELDLATHLPTQTH